MKGWGTECSLCDQGYSRTSAKQKRTFESWLFFTGFKPIFACARAKEADQATGRAFEVANESFTIATNMHREGANGYLDLLDANRTLISAQQERLSA